MTSRTSLCTCTFPGPSSGTLLAVSREAPESRHCSGAARGPHKPHFGGHPSLTSSPREHPLPPRGTCHTRRERQGCRGSGRARPFRRRLVPEDARKRRGRRYLQRFHQAPLGSAEGNPLDSTAAQAWVPARSAAASPAPCALGPQFPRLCSGLRPPPHPRKAKPKGS